MSELGIGFEVESFEGDKLILNMGPQHPSTHGVLRLILTISGENVIDCKPDIGFLHRGVEKLCESLNYVQIPPILERNDYLSPISNALCFVLALEKAGNVEVPRRAKYIRTLLAEISRITSHMIAIGTYGLDLGGALGGGTSVFMRAFRIREFGLALMEEFTGTRFHLNAVQIGGVRYDIPSSEWIDKAKKFCELSEKFIHDELIPLVEKNPTFKARTIGVGILPPEIAKLYGCSGPVLRGSGIAYDVRKSEPYDAYGELDFKVIVQNGCDCYSRWMVRGLEVIESVKIIRQIIDGIPSGPISSRPPLKAPVAFKPPENIEVYARVESPRGEMGAFIVSDNTTKPYRLKLRSPSFSNISVLPYLVKNVKIPDVIAILGSLDPVFGDVDR